MKIKFIIVFLLLPIGLFAQKESDNLSMKGRPGMMWFYTGLRPAQPEKVRRYDRLILDLTYNDWIGDRDLFKNHWASIGMNTNLMFDIPMAPQNTVSFGIGLCHQWVSIRHDNNLYRNNVSYATDFLSKSPVDDFEKSKYGEHSILMPIEFRFRSKGWKHFKFQIGGKVGYKFQSYSKYSGGEPFKYDSKTFGFYDDTKWIYSAHVRFGLRNWALFGNYQFNKIFSSSESVQLNLIQFGLSVSLF